MWARNWPAAVKRRKENFFRVFLSLSCVFSDKSRIN